MRHLTIEENEAFQKAARASLGLVREPRREVWEGSIGAQLAAHLIERNDRLASDVSNASARIEKLEARLKGTIVAAILFGVISGMGKLLW